MSPRLRVGLIGADSTHARAAVFPLRPFPGADSRIQSRRVLLHLPSEGMPLLPRKPGFQGPDQLGEGSGGGEGGKGEIVSKYLQLEYIDVMVVLLD